MTANMTAPGDWLKAEADYAIGMNHRFDVVIGRFPLGGWQKVSGLTVNMQGSDIKQAGFNTYHVHLPESPVWAPIVLSRAVVEAEWLLTFEWLMDTLCYPQSPGLGSASNPLNSLIITINNAWGDPIRALHFSNCRPIKWEGPNLDATQSKEPAIEKLTLTHEGLFPDGIPETSP